MLENVIQNLFLTDCDFFLNIATATGEYLKCLTHIFILEIF